MPQVDLLRNGPQGTQVVEFAADALPPDFVRRRVDGIGDDGHARDRYSRMSSGLSDGVWFSSKDVRKLSYPGSNVWCMGAGVLEQLAVMRAGVDALLADAFASCSGAELIEFLHSWASRAAAGGRGR